MYIYYVRRIGAAQQQKREEQQKLISKIAAIEDLQIEISQ